MPPGFEFRGRWRSYQSRLLQQLHTEKDRRFNVVAAPGSGKTVLGLGVLHRLGQPALILAPTRAIREQWAERLQEHFLPKGARRPAWVSQDLDKPGWITIGTYQALHGQATVDEEDLAEGRSADAAVQALARRLKRAGVQTLVLDEAHHLRGAWWSVLSKLKDGLGDPFLLSLTGTPPYDVPEHEWKRYEGLCGTVDAEISIPEMVLEKNLCAHQDYVYLCEPLAAEAAKLRALRGEAETLVKELPFDHALGDALLKHPWVAAPQQHEEAVLDHADEACALVVFLHAQGLKDQPGLKALRKLLNAPLRVPKFDLGWAERLLQGLVSPQGLALCDAPRARKLAARLRAMGALDRGLVHLREQPGAAKLLAVSGAKLSATRALVDFEWKALGEGLRLVVLSDFVGAEDLELAGAAATKHLSVGAIYQGLAQRAPKGLRLAAVSGQGCVLPESERAWMKAHKLKPIPVEGLPGHLKADMGVESSGRLLGELTDAFAAGRFHVLVGTRALLGEGWDAPFVNALVLATWVKASMSSNQMRGRSIRVDPKAQRKVANVWHLACVELEREGRGEDYLSLRRRFRSFVGVPSKGWGLENGLERLGLGTWSLNSKDVADLNEDSLRQAEDRPSVLARWARSLKAGTQARMRETVQSPTPRTPRPALLRYTGAALLFNSLSVGGVAALQYYLPRYQELAAWAQGGPTLAVSIGLVGVSLLMAKRLLRGLWLLLLHGSPGASLKQMGKAVLGALAELDHIRLKPYPKLVVRREANGMLSCGVDGLGNREEGLFCQAMQELLDPVGDPRYLVVRKGALWGIDQHDCHGVPSLFAGRKEDALVFQKHWNKHVCPGRVVFTRRAKGRRMLLRARWDSLAGGAEGRSEPKVVWS